MPKLANSARLLPSSRQVRMFRSRHAHNACTHLPKDGRVFSDSKFLLRAAETLVGQNLRLLRPPLTTYEHGKNSQVCQVIVYVRHQIRLHPRKAKRIYTCGHCVQQSYPFRCTKAARSMSNFTCNHIWWSRNAKPVLRARETAKKKFYSGSAARFSQSTNEFDSINDLRP